MKEKKVEYLILRDASGEEAELEILDYINYRGRNYVVLYPADAGEDEDVIIMLRKKDEYFFVEDPKIVDGVYQEFLKNLK